MVIAERSELNTGTALATTEFWDNPHQMRNETRESFAEVVKSDIPPWRPVRAASPRPRKPVLVDGLLRRGHVMLISGKGKIGKTFLCIQLALCVAFGLEWLGIKCNQGKVLFINPEVDEDSFDNRVSEMCDQLRIDKNEVSKRMAVWNTRREPQTIGNIVKQIERFSDGNNFALIILDSISCYIEGDESKSHDVRSFTGEVNKLAEIANAAVVMIQHHGKGNQGERTASDRARGSSVFLDAPDTVVSITEVFPQNGIVEDYLEEGQSAFKFEVPGNREFPPFKPINVIKKNSMTCLDEAGITKDWTFEKTSSGSNGGKAKKLIAEATKERDFERYQNKLIAALIERGGGDEGITCKEAANLLGIKGANPSRVLNRLFIEYGEQREYVKDDFVTCEYATRLLSMRKKVGKSGRETQDWYVIPRFLVA